MALIFYVFEIVETEEPNHEAEYSPETSSRASVASGRKKMNTDHPSSYVKLSLSFSSFSGREK